MERFAAWLWRRHRHRYPTALGTVVLGVMVFGLMPAILPAVWAILGLTGEDCLVIGVVAAPTLACGPFVAIAGSKRRREAVTSWGRGDTSDPAEAWAAAVHAPPEWTERATAANLVATYLVIVPVIAQRGDLTAVEVVILCAMLAVLFVGGGLALGSGFQELLRPMLDEVVAHLPPTGIVSTPARWSLRGRFYVAIATTCFLSGVLTAAFVTRTHTRASALLVSLVLGAVTAAYMLVLFGGLLVRPTLRPVADLTVATARVRRGEFDRPVPVTTADDFGELSAAFNDMQRGLREREALQEAFGSYVDPVLALRLIESGSAVFEGEEVVVSVLFADVRDFTSFSEQVEPATAVARLNLLFDLMVPILHEHGGHANHYLGDGLLAVFGAPQPLDGHADAAVAAAVDIQRGVRASFGTGLRLGIGINSGPVIAGTVGGGGRHEFTVIGDTVNTAARVEQLTKVTGDAILVTEATRAALSVPRPRSTRRGEHEVRGKAAGVTLHAINPFPRSSR